MVDIVDSKTRSRMMSGIRGKNTKPELLVRSSLHQKGYRYRLHVKDLPGKPDLVFPKYNAVIFIHGCFWHGHGCHLFKWPSSNPDFWRKKINRNTELDYINHKKLIVLGWRILDIWECALRGPSKWPYAEVVNRIESWLNSDQNSLVLTEIRDGNL